MASDWVPICGYGVENAFQPFESEIDGEALYMPIVQPMAGQVDADGIIVPQEQANMTVGVVETQRRYRVHRIVGQIAFGTLASAAPDMVAQIQLAFGQWDWQSQTVTTPWAAYGYPSNFLAPWLGVLLANPVMNAVNNSFPALYANDNFLFSRRYTVSGGFSTDQWMTTNSHPWWSTIDMRFGRKGVSRALDQPLGLEVTGFDRTASGDVIAFTHWLRAYVTT